MRVEVVSSPNCPQCKVAKNFLNKSKIEFTEKMLTSGPMIQEFVEKYPDAKTLPQIFIDGERVGSLEEFKKRVQEAPTCKSPSRTYKPFNYPWAVDVTIDHEKMHWIEDEVDLAEDVNDWKTGRVTLDEKDFITNILRLFTQSDVAVGKTYFDFFIPAIKNNEIRNMLGSFAAREGIHQRAYALLNDTLGLPDSEYQAFLEYKEMSDKIDHMTQCDASTDDGIAISLAKSVFNEGVSLFASFAMLLNFQRVGKMKGMGKIVEFSVRDEALVEGTLVVTERGDIPIERITLNDRVLQMDMNTKVLSYVTPNKTQRVQRDVMYDFQHPRFNQRVSPGHRMIYTEGGTVKECIAENFTPSENKFFLVIDQDVISEVASSEVEISRTDLHRDTSFYCLSVPGQAFVVKDMSGNMSVTGNTQHVIGISKLFRVFCEEHPYIVTDAFKKLIYDIARTSVALEDKFIELVYKRCGSIEGLSETDVRQYIRYIADRRLIQLGLKPNFGVKENPLDWMDWVLNGTDHTNFFENRVTDYVVGGLTGEWVYE